MERTDLFTQFLDAGPILATNDAFPVYDGLASNVVKNYICPSDGSDPSLLNANDDLGGKYGSSSYAGNVMVFNPVVMAQLNAAMPDGTSNTVMVAERILVCDVSIALGWSSTGYSYTGMGWAWIYVDHGDGSQWVGFGWRSAAVSDSQSIFDLRTDFVDGSIPFQVGAKPSTCNIYITQSTHSSVMQVLVGDASVRGVASTISPTTWVRACTPDDGEVLGSDWAY